MIEIRVHNIGKIPTRKSKSIVELKRKMVIVLDQTSGEIIPLRIHGRTIKLTTRVAIIEDITTVDIREIANQRNALFMVKRLYDLVLPSKIKLECYHSNLSRNNVKPLRTQREKNNIWEQYECLVPSVVRHNPLLQSNQRKSVLYMWVSF